MSTGGTSRAAGLHGRVGALLATVALGAAACGGAPSAAPTPTTSHVAHPAHKPVTGAPAQGGATTSTARRVATTSTAPTATVASSTTSTSIGSTPTVPPSSAPPSATSGTGPGALPQTDVLPTTGTPQFAAEMAALWSGIIHDNVAIAEKAFFPEAAYLQVKAIPDPAADYADRLIADFQLDIAAAGAYLGPKRLEDRLVKVTVPPTEAAWIPPGACYNAIGYWHDPGARLIYSAGGKERSIGIASFISWRGVWYVVHLGAVLRASATGIVDAPALGAGVPGAPGGC